ncbi:C1GALT1-specific chaperone 1 [Engraulis encrasicolus]|uniref:C1GALT1-specific chaperone 1 n=1 Tax=Engraulis encrasicolus TaxID=184585 RepID=UPI002FD317C8
MISEGSSFVKGMAMGAVFCLLLSILGSFSPNVPGSSDPEEEHHHHHVIAPNTKDMQELSQAEMVELSQKVRVYCLIMVTPKVLVHWAAANSTWAKHCDKAAYYTSESSKAMDAIDLKESDEWARIRVALKHAYENAGDMRWFFMARPTTFAIIENLKYLILDKDPSQPFYLGRSQKSGELEYVEFDSGIVFSYDALRRLMDILKNDDLCPARGRAIWKVSEEKQLAICLKYAGVYAENGEDAHGLSLFNSQSISTLITDSISKNPDKVLESCCSDMAISFSGLSPNQMQVMMYGVYRLRPYGHDFHDSMIFLPPKGSDND